MRILCLIGLLGLALTLRAQCIFPINEPIPGAADLNFPLYISGLTNDDLAGTQGICGVRLTFEHEFIGNLQFELVSPSGEIVYLTGPQTPANFTNGATWDVLFVPCADVAMPDPGLANQWNNGGNWSIGGSYTGSYFPFSGCLEDFDAGSANGIWMLHVVNDLFYTGFISNIELIFCDDDGLFCQPCQPLAASFPDSLYTFCQGDENLNTFLPDTLFNQETPPGPYNQAFILVNNGNIVQLSGAPDWSSLPPMTYEIYHISYLAQFSAIIQSLVGSGLNTLDQLIDVGSICAERSSDFCILEILPTYTNPPVRVVLCQGETYSFNGLELTRDTTIINHFSASNGCDSVMTLTLNFISSEITIHPDTLDCQTPVVSILADLNNFSPSGTQIISSQWSDENGNQIANGLMADISQPGQYTFSVTLIFNAITCTYDTTIFVPEIMAIPADPIIQFDPPCTGYPVLFHLQSDLLRQQTTWELAGNPIVDGDNDSLFVTWNTPGTYEVCVVALNACGQSARVCEEVTVSAAPVVSIPDGGIFCNVPLEFSIDGSSVNLSWQVVSGAATISLTGNGSQATVTPQNIPSDVIINISGQIEGCPITKNLELKIVEPVSLTGLHDTVVCNGDIVHFDLNINHLPATIYYTINGQQFQEQVSQPAHDFSFPVSSDFTLILDSIVVTSGYCFEQVGLSYQINIAQEPFANFTDQLTFCNSLSESGLPIYFLPDLITDGDKSGIWNISGIPGALIRQDSLDLSNVTPGTYHLLYQTNVVGNPCPQVSYDILINVEACVCSIAGGLQPDDAFKGICDHDQLVILDEFYGTTVNVIWSVMDPQSGQTVVIADGILDLTQFNTSQLELTLTTEQNWAGECPDNYELSLQLDQPLSAGFDDALTYCFGEGEMLWLDTILTGQQDVGSWFAVPGQSIPGLNLAFNPGNHTLNASQLGQGTIDFWHILRNNGVCPNDTAVLEIQINGLPEIDISGKSRLGCGDSLIVLNLTTDIPQSVQVDWMFNGNPMGSLIPPDEINLTHDGTYQIYLQDLMTGCKDTIDHIILPPANPIVNAVIDKFQSCELQVGQINVVYVDGGEAPYYYALNNGDYDVYPVFYNLVAGIYTVKIKDINDCLYESNVILSQLELNGISLGQDTTVNSGNPVFIEAHYNVNGFKSIEWFVNGVLQDIADYRWTFNPEKTSNVTVRLTDLNGCMSTDDMIIFVKDDVDIFVPNAFSPNNDGNNDVLFIPENRDIKEILTFDIFDRWGNHIFMSRNTPTGTAGLSWDGTFHGQKLNPAVFVFKVRYASVSGNVYEKYGNVTLIR